MQPGNKAALVKSIEYLLADPEIRKDIGINAREKAETKYTWSNAASKLVDIYDGIFQT
jgi:glycosyltransferase involved in cell wall biosynthesis